MFLLSACAFCAVVSAASTPSPQPTATPPEIAHVYTAERADVTLRNSARTTYVVTADEIARNGYRTIAQALQDVPAMMISPLGAVGATANMSLRGSSSAQVLVLIDGLPAPGSFSNTVELGNLPTAGVDRIEVVEGGGSTLYGSGAMGGTINIITQRTGQTSAIARLGSFADRELELNAPNVQLDRIVSGNAFPLPNGSTRPDVDYESTGLHGNYAHRLGAFDLAVRAGIENDRVGAPGPDGAYLSPSTRENDENENADLTLAHAGLQSQATMQAGVTSQHVLYWCDPASDPNCFQPFPDLTTEARVDFGARNVVSNADGQLIYGLDLSRGTVRGENQGYASPPLAFGSLAQSAVYAQDRADFRWGSIYGGVRGERDGAYGGEISPSTGLIWRTSVTTAIKANLATAFRAPNGTELFFPGFSNPNLQPERADVADISFGDSAFLGGASIGWFGNRTRDLIVSEPVSAVSPSCVIDAASFTYAPCNVAHALIEGVTATARTLPYDGFIASLELTDLYRAENLDTQSRLPNDPVVTASLRLDYKDAFGIVSHTAGTRQPFSSQLPLYDQSAGYTSVDAYARFRLAGNTLLSLRGYNLGNERYGAVSGFPMPGRSYLVELTAR